MKKKTLSTNYYDNKSSAWESFHSNTEYSPKEQKKPLQFPTSHDYINFLSKTIYID